jgi:hypothetical protein
MVVADDQQQGAAGRAPCLRTALCDQEETVTERAADELVFHLYLPHSSLALAAETEMLRA